MVSRLQGVNRPPDCLTIDGEVPGRPTEREERGKESSLDRVPLVHETRLGSYLRCRGQR